MNSAKIGQAILGTETESSIFGLADEKVLPDAIVSWLQSGEYLLSGDETVCAVHWISSQLKSDPGRA